MNVISLRDYAKQNNISYEAVRQQVVRYAEELGTHIIKDGRQQFLDEEAVTFLDTKRQKNPVAIIHKEKDEQIEELENEIKKLLVKTADQAVKISELTQWKADNALAIAEANNRQLLLEANEKKIVALEADNAAKEREKEILEGFIADAKVEIEAQKAEKAEISAERDKERERADRAEKTAQEANLELEGERNRRITFKEYWRRRKNKEQGDV